MQDGRHRGRVEGVFRQKGKLESGAGKAPDFKLLGFALKLELLEQAGDVHPSTGIPSEVFHFRFSKILKFLSKSAIFAFRKYLETAIIVNIYGVILNFAGFFGSDPHPTREK